MQNEIVLTGASGLLGHHLIQSAKANYRPLSRSEKGWDPENGVCDPALLERTKAVIHLAGAPIADGRWTDARKKAIFDSRVNGTRAIATAMATLPDGPRTLICASAVGLYGNRGDEELHESSSVGNGFLPDVVQAWEKAADPARDAGIRVVHLRFGIILSPQGGALKKMLPVFKLGLGGKLGKGNQWMSWIHALDATRFIENALEDSSIEGAYNLVAPHPATNLEFTKTLGKTLHRPTLFPAPAWLLHLALGEMGETLLLEGNRVLPTRWRESGMSFDFPTLENALKDLLR
jgi:uncharacterized protein (TIGR01777 family)